MAINVTTFPNDILYVITRFLSPNDKISVRETCIDLNNSVRFMELRIENMNIKFDKIINGRNYILARLRLAALCGLNTYEVAEIWSWVSLFQEQKQDALSILRQLGEAIV